MLQEVWEASNMHCKRKGVIGKQRMQHRHVPFDYKLSDESGREDADA